MAKGIRNILIMVIILGVVAILLTQSSSKSNNIFKNNETLKMSDINKKAMDGEIIEVVFKRDQITGQLKNRTKFSVQNPNPTSQEEFEKVLREKAVPYSFEQPMFSEAILTVFGYLLLPIMLLFLFYWIIIKPAQQGSNQAMNFGRSKARRAGENIPKVTFEDVAGADEAKQELAEVVDFLRNTRKFTALGAKIPRGVLLLGPPGCGKTLLARAIAGEAGVPFFHISGSDFVEMFVGVGAARVRDLFETAKAHRPSLIFIDEIDAVGRLRGAGLGGGHDEREQTLNQLLVEMDGFDPNTGVILIAATNRPDVLDPALLRPGRFDRQIVVDAPDKVGRKAILKIHAKGKPLSDDVDADTIAKRTPGFTGADLANIVNEAALLAARRDKNKISMSEFDEAMDRVMAGPQRKSRVFDLREKQTIAYHEVGHAIIGELLEHSDPVHKVTILPRGMALGMTLALPEKDKYLASKSELMDKITMMLGGRVAEEIVFDEVTTGSQNDLQRATEIARAMVCDYGMSEKLGSLTFGRRHGNPFLGRDLMEDRNYSEDVASEIDTEVKQIIDISRQRAGDVLRANKERMDTIVQELLVKESLSRDEFLTLLRGAIKIDGTEWVKKEETPDLLKQEELPSTQTQPLLEPGTA